MTRSAHAPAKINLYLHVGRPNADGRHPLDSLVVFARDAGDRITASRADDLSLTITGAFAGELPLSEDNLVLRAARVLAAHARIEPRAALVLYKHLPVASGIGGGSADAAATLRLLNDVWALDVSMEVLEAIAAQLGADVPACVRAQTVRMTGTGETIEAARCPPLHAVLVNPGVLTPTATVYRAFDRANLGRDLPRVSLAPETSRDMIRWLAAQANDLEPAASTIAPEIGEVLAVLRRHAPDGLVRMSGSGATCFALVADGSEAERVAGSVKEERPHWWVHAVLLA